MCPKGYSTPTISGMSLIISIMTQVVKSDVRQDSRLTAGITGKGGIWQTNLPDACKASAD